MDDATQVSQLSPASLKLGERFLHEGPIRWLLATGIILLLGSSIMLVKTHWESIGPLAKYAIFLAYTTGLWVVGDFATHHRGLRRTGTVLMGLTVVLLPLTFAALATVEMGFVAGALLAIHLAIGWTASRRIFRHFLRGDQPTFVASYFILAASAFVAPLAPQSWAPGMLLLLWAVFAAGTLKVNRHVFWLTEERRVPRIFGFFPILLLAGQYFTIAAIYFVPATPTPWLGVFCELTAVPILLAARAVTDVFRKRTGDLVRPLPWSVMLPLIAGLLLVFCGLVLAGSSLATGTTLHAIVPAAAIAAFLLGSVARDTGKSFFVWGMLAGITLAYNFSPAFFMDIARQVVRWGADAVHEEKLPYAFYGLTYLPLLAALTLLVPTLRRAGNELFARPLRWFCIAVAALLLMVAVPEPSARFPVSLAMLGLFGLQAHRFTDRRLVLLATLSWVVTAWGIVPFASHVFLVEGIETLTVPVLAAALGALLAARLFDVRLRRLGIPEKGSGFFNSSVVEQWAERPLASVSLAASLVLATVWFLGVALVGNGVDGTWTHWLAISALIVAHALRFAKPLLGFLALVFLLGGASVLAVDEGNRAEDVLAAALLIVVLLSAVGHRTRDLGHRVARTFATPARQLGRWVLTGALAFLYVPEMLVQILYPGMLDSPGALGWLARIAVVTWTFYAAPRHLSRSTAWGGGAAAFLLVGAAWATLGSVSMQWLPVIWGAMALALSWALARRKNIRLRLLCGPANEPLAYVLSPLRSITFAAALLLALIGGAFLAWELRLAGLFAIAALTIMRARTSSLWMLGNWQLLAVVARLAAPEAVHIFDFRSLIPDASIALALGASVSLLMWYWTRPAQGFGREPLIIHRQLLGGLLLVMMAASLTLPFLGPWEIVGAVGIFLALASREFLGALRHHREALVWKGLACLAAGVGFLALHDVIVFRQGWSLLGVLCAGLVLWGIGHGASGRKQIEILRRPLLITGMLLPGIAGVLGIGRSLFEDPTRWQFYTAAFTAAAFYLWRGIEEKRSTLVLASAIIGNAALLLVWRSLSWDDTQLYLIPLGVSLIGIVQLLREEIPSRLRDPLRYVGTLVILISPVPDIFQGSWTHILSLMLVAVGVVLFSLAAKIRVLLALGIAFLVADMIAMVVRGSMEHPELLWIAGIGLGTAILLLGAFCEDRRETVRQQMRSLSAAFADWE